MVSALKKNVNGQVLSDGKTKQAIRKGENLT